MPEMTERNPLPGMRAIELTPHERTRIREALFAAAQSISSEALASPLLSIRRRVAEYDADQLRRLAERFDV